MCSCVVWFDVLVHVLMCSLFMCSCARRNINLFWLWLLQIWIVGHQRPYSMPTSTWRFLLVPWQTTPVMMVSMTYLLWIDIRIQSVLSYSWNSSPVSTSRMILWENRYHFVKESKLLNICLIPILASNIITDTRLVVHIIYHQPTLLTMVEWRKNNK